MRERFGCWLRRMLSLALVGACAVAFAGFKESAFVAEGYFIQYGLYLAQILSER